MQLEQASKTRIRKGTDDETNHCQLEPVACLKYCQIMRPENHRLFMRHPFLTLASSWSFEPWFSSVKTVALSKHTGFPCTASPCLTLPGIIRSVNNGFLHKWAGLFPT